MGFINQCQLDLLQFKTIFYFGDDYKVSLMLCILTKHLLKWHY